MSITIQCILAHQFNFDAFWDFFVFCRKSIILLGATLIPPSLKCHGGPDCGSPNSAGSPRRQIRFLLRAPSREDTLPPGSQGRKKRCAGKSVLEPAGDFSNLEPVWNGGLIPIIFPSKLAGEPTLLAVPGFDLVTSWQLKTDHDVPQCVSRLKWRFISCRGRQRTNI